jgi:hypothetical protein
MRELWRVGVLEYWSDGNNLETFMISSTVIFSSLRDSITPIPTVTGVDLRLAS